MRAFIQWLRKQLFPIPGTCEWCGNPTGNENWECDSCYTKREQGRAFND